MNCNFTQNSRMNFMHQTSRKQVLLLIATATILLGTALISKNDTDKNAPSAEIQKMDAMLLSDLRHQEIEFTDETKTIMECSGMSEIEIKNYFDLENVNYSKCDPGNCHYTSYTIESKTGKGKNISFVLTSGEDGNHLDDLQIEGCN